MIRSLFSRLWLILAFLMAWEAMVRISGVSSIVMPSFSRSLLALVERPETFVMPMLMTTAWSLVGLGFGTCIGIGIAGLSWFSGLFRAVLMPMALIVASIPVVAIMPILTHMFGSGAGGVISVVAAITFLPVLIYTSAGLQAVPAGALGLFTAFGARKSHFLFRLALPAARPSILISLRIAAPTSLFAAITAEYLTSQTGLGALIRNSMAMFDIEAIMGAALLACVLSILFSAAAARVERRLLADLGHA